MDRRVFVSFESLGYPKVGADYALPKDTSHHLANVLRLKAGSNILILNSEGGEAAFVGELLAENGKVRILRSLPLEERVSPVHTLVFAISKGEKNDFVCEKATELGVSKIVFWESARSIVRLKSSEDLEKKLKRWREISKSSASQCRRENVAEVEVAKTVEAVLSALTPRSFLCSLAPDALPLGRAIENKEPFTLIVGPEGDLSPDEERTLREFGCIPVSLGPYVLRAETAAVVAIAQAVAVWEIL